jgi:hypothetical protein
MAISLSTVTVRHERRVQLVFTNTLAAAAFTNLSFYTLANQDSLGVSPAVVAAFIIPSNPNVVELGLDQDLVRGARYTIAAISVPAGDASVTPTGSTLPFRTGAAVEAVNAEVTSDDTSALVYGADIIHDGLDYVEDATGDLAIMSGPQNAAQALLKRATSDGVPWNPTYGGKPRQYVDGAPGELPTLRGQLLREFYKDDRVQSVTSAIVVDVSDPATATIAHQVKLVGVNGLVPISVSMPGS